VADRFADAPRSKLLDEAEARKFDAEARQLEAETLRTQAEAAKFELEARTAALQFQSQEIRFAEQRRTYQESLASDKYHHVFHFAKPIMDGSVEECMRALSLWRRMDADKPPEEKAPIEIVFSSPGGSAIAGMALYDVIQETKREGHFVTTSTVGYAASMAGILLQAGNKRVMGKESYILIHEISFGAGGKIGEVEDETRFIRKLQSRILNIFADRSHKAHLAGTARHAMTADEVAHGLPLKLSKQLGFASEVQGWARADWWLDADEALTLGFVDEVR
jgi:ATP-dependent Clp protease protease subunit